MRAFTGYGRPTWSALSCSTSSTLGGYIEATLISLNIGGFSTTVVFERQSGASWISIGSPAVFTTNGTKTVQLNMPGDNTSYTIRARVYNMFVIEDWLTTNTSSATSSGPNVFPAPAISSAVWSGNNIQAYWNYGNSPNSFSAQWSAMGVSWTNLAGGSSSNWGTSTNPKSGIWTPAQSGLNNTQIRIRANAQGGVGASDWSLPAIVML